MMTRRVAASMLAVALAVPSCGGAEAFEFRRYEEGAAKATIASGKSVILHVYAPWCLQCRAQASILARMSDDPQLDHVSFYKVDYDNQKEVVEALDVPRSTLIGYKNGREVARMSWGTAQEDVVRVLQAAF